MAMSLWRIRLFRRGTPYSDICGTVEYSYDVDKANQLMDDAGWTMNESTESGKRMEHRFI